MRYILDDNGYIDSVSCTPFNCKDKSCKEYTGTIPSGYETLAEWAQNANIRAYKLVEGNLTLDEAKKAELEAEWQTMDGKNLLFNGVASAGDTITLKDDYTKYNLLHIVTGTDTEDYGSALLASSLSPSEEIDACKVFSNTNGMLQIHVATFDVVDTKTLTLRSAYWQRVASSGSANLGNPTTCKVRRIYGTL